MYRYIQSNVGRGRYDCPVGLDRYRYISDVAVVDAGGYEGVNKYSSIVNREHLCDCPQLVQLTEAACSYLLTLHIAQISK